MEVRAIFSQVLEDQVEAEQVSLDSDKPLGKISQDPLLAQHVPCIDIMSLGPITRPCTGTDLCNPGTTSGHLSTGRKGECTSRLQGGCNITEGLEQEV